ncbi:MAG TPA: Holliday junction resolvase RuvX [Candidatus Saccharimonadales bacterium]|nr:Holliday junction resolvase RuvX [Candidatus Saccharimonadales bacterium]
MEKLLGIDFGLKKIGVSIATSKLADPYLVIRYSNIEELIEKIDGICEKEGIGRVIIGVSEGEMAIATKEFGEKLALSLPVPVDFFDETLSTQDAQRLAMDAHMKRSKRKEMEDAMAAAVMLQNYLDMPR